jgi:hypothetical protein
MTDWLGSAVEGPLEGVHVAWVAPEGAPGLAVQFLTPRGVVRV